MYKLLTLCAMALIFSPAMHAAEKKNPLSDVYTVVDANELKTMMEEQDNLIVIDSRGGKYFDGELIKGAVQLSAKETDADSLKMIVADKDQPIVFYCSNVDCPASQVAAVKAQKIGYSSLYKYPGGIEDWRAKGLPIVKTN